ncbi:GNAT family N-acetyltransferase [Flavobacterium cellulosilyticum]|uniref:GNAT family N-acetyltransferase n=1 Tax=Flavobacterium cellulosilyticum TaxID=2541731 RepID=A0A4R5C3Y4_9FLAO|nr:GNAT family N-acetyltransferase [Flavobacterium cellulosilyticum]TDD94391.1 GNAT family N-acetyltransferase [Flavobacterium cellulosilyticum]
MSKHHFRKAEISEASTIWEILQQAIVRRKKDGSNQWQDGYPNLEVVQKDLAKGVGYVLTHGTSIIGYCAVAINDEPEYTKIEGKWVTNEDFVVFHRLAISEKYLGTGFAKMIFQFIEEFAIENNIYSIKADTNFDNFAMLAIFKQLSYSYCGEVYFRGSPRKAFEKILAKVE